MEDEIISLDSLTDFFQNSIDLPELSNSLTSIFGNSILESIYIGEACHYEIDNGFYLSAYIGLPINIELNIPTINLIKIKLGLPDQQLIVSKFYFFFQLIDTIPTWRLSLRDINSSIIFDRNILKKVNTSDLGPIGSEILIKTGISIDQNLNYLIEPVEASLSLSCIGNTNFKISAEKVKFNLIPNNPEVSLKKLRFIPPQGLFPNSLAMPAFTIKKATINKNGFTGSVEVAWDLNYENNEFLIDIINELGIIERKPSTLFTIPGGIKLFKIQFENNIPIASEIKGLIRMPYFDQDIAVSITFDESGNFKISLDTLSPEGILISKEDLVAMYLKCLSIDQETSSIIISGGLEPLLYASEGMKWPRMDIKNLNIDSTGKFSIDEAWLDLNDLATVDLFGFKLELRKIGLGSVAENNTDKLWIDLSGGLKLIDQIPIGVDVEGFRILWPQNKNIQQFTPNDIGIQFKGVQFSFGVPGAIQLDGLIRFIKDENVTAFAGDMVLVIPAAGITAEAGLLVGMNAEQPNPYPFFYVYFGLEAAAGIPLGQSGLALKGAIGLFGINVSPNRQEGQNWYYDWYKKAPAPGAHQTTKWGNERDALAVGAGVTITTVDGVVKGTKGIIVLALPGPILVINGKALILDGLNPNPNAEPPFSATAIFDGKQKIVQFNIEAQAEIVKDVVDAYAAVEAFFDFKDITNWHLYLGQDEPKDRRIRANILNIIEADAYLMLDMLDANSPRARMGVAASIKPKIDSVCFNLPLIGEQCIKFDAHVDIGGKGEISMQPEQFSGSGCIDAGIDISGFGLELEIGAKVDVSVEGPLPFSLQGDLNLYANLPDPLPDYEDTFHFELKIPKVEVKVNNPLIEVSLFSRFTTESKRSTVYEQSINDVLKFRENAKDENGNIISPMVPCDVNPILSFEHEMNQSTSFLMSPEGQKKYYVGALEVTPRLTKVVIRERDKKADSSWKVIYSTVTSEQKPIIGTWLAESDPSSASRPASRRLQLLTLNPLSNTMHSNGMSGFLMMQSEAESKHLSELILADYPEIICKDYNIKPHCLDFKFNGKPIISKKIKWSKLNFISDQLMELSGACLKTEKELNIVFPEKVYSVTISFCNKPEKIDIKASYSPRKKELKKMIDEFKNKLSSLDINLNKEAKIEISSASSNSVQTITCTEFFERLNLSTKDKEGLNIKSICYYTVREKENSEITKNICNSNKSLLAPTAPHNQPSYSNDQFIDNSIFRPGMYYEIEVESSLSVEVLANRIEESDSKNYIIDQYISCIEKFPNTISSFAYFQTDAPPQNLTPYIKWSIPAAQESNSFIKDPVHIRFKRGYLNTLLDYSVISEYRLKVYLKDTKGNISLITQGISWQTANSSTLFPDEETWNDYLVNNGLVSPIKKDGILTINLNNPIYKSNSRYELLFVGIKRNDLTNEEEAKKLDVIKIDGTYYNLMASKSFKTSRFDSFLNMLKSANTTVRVDIIDNIPTIWIKPTVEKGSSVKINFNFNDLANAELAYYKGLVDYEYGIIQQQKSDTKLVSKEALEELKILHRKQKDSLDDVFRTKALALNQELFFRDEGNILGVYAITFDMKLEYIWVKLPEPIQLKFNQNSIGANEIKLIRIKNRNRIYSNFKYTMLFNSDTTQIIFKLENPIDIQLLSTLKIVFSKIKDHNDDISNGNMFGPNKNTHHRYDRPSLKNMETEIIEFKFD
jgi:hypothetical protein